MESPLTPPDLQLEGKQGASVFFSYSHRDKGFRDRLEEHLSNLKYRGLITTWYDREISAGEEWAQETSEEARKRRYFEDAIEAYRNALAHNPSDADALRGMGNALYALGNYNQALDAFTRAIDYGATPAAYAGLGDVFAKLKRYSEAVDAYEKALELDPTITFKYDDYVQALHVLGRKEEAEHVRARTRQLGYDDQE